jgi:hypothetical protein
LGQGDFDEVQKIEKDLDAKLLSSFNVALGRYDYAFTGKAEVKLRLKVIFEIQRRYEVAGWGVNLVRDGEECTGMVLVAPDAPPQVTLQSPTAHRRLMAKEDAA